MTRTSVLAFALVLATFACNSVSGPSGPTGTLNLRLTDSPFTEADAVLVTFRGVRAHRSESDWTAVPFADATAVTRTCDLKKLQAAEDILGTGPLVAGQYTMIRLVVESAKLYFDNPTDPAEPACVTTTGTVPAGLSANVTISSGEVKLNRPFTIDADATTTILLDFDGDRSINLTGNGTYMMSPVIAIVSVTPQTPPQP